MCNVDIAEHDIAVSTLRRIQPSVPALFSAFWILNRREKKSGVGVGVFNGCGCVSQSKLSRQILVKTH